MFAVWTDAPHRMAISLMTLIFATSLAGCGSSGFGAQAESWNSYYYGTSSNADMNDREAYAGKDSDDNYQLPRKYQVFEGARDNRIASENIMHPNP